MHNLAILFCRIPCRQCGIEDIKLRYDEGASYQLNACNSKEGWVSICAFSVYSDKNTYCTTRNQGNCIQKQEGYGYYTWASPANNTQSMENSYKVNICHTSLKTEDWKGAQFTALGYSQNPCLTKIWEAKKLGTNEWCWTKCKDTWRNSWGLKDKETKVSTMITEGMKRTSLSPDRYWRKQKRQNVPLTSLGKCNTQTIKEVKDFMPP